MVSIPVTAVTELYCSIATVCKTLMDGLRGAGVVSQSGGPTVIWEIYVTYIQITDAVDYFGVSWPAVAVRETLLRSNV